MNTATAGVAAPTIHISAAVVTDEAGNTLVVRKRGARLFQQPGGKPDAGEDAVTALLRELNEEIGVVLSPEALEPLGRFEDTATNEPGHRVVADAFAVRVRKEQVSLGAEIVESRWLSQDEAARAPLAHLSRNHLLRLSWR